MEIERCHNPNYKTAYLLSDFEIKKITKSLKSEIKNVKRKLDRLVNNPNNEGQATYLDKEDNLKEEIKQIEHMIDLFEL